MVLATCRLPVSSLEGRNETQTLCQGFKYCPSAPTTVQGATDGAPKMPESLEAAASKHESSTSISGEDKSKTQNLNSGTVYRLDSKT